MKKCCECKNKRNGSTCGTMSEEANAIVSIFDTLFNFITGDSEELEDIIEEYGEERRSVNLDSEIEKVVFNDPATVVFWKDGTKTVSKAAHGDVFNKETGLAIAIVRKLCGNKNYNKVFSKWCN